MVTGTLCTIFVFIIEQLGGILPLAVAFTSVTAGPLVGMFTLGILVPRCTARVKKQLAFYNTLKHHNLLKGALWGGIIGLLSIGMVIFTAQYYIATGAIHHEPKPISVEGCPSYVNVTVPSIE